MHVCIWVVLSRLQSTSLYQRYNSVDRRNDER